MILRKPWLLSLPVPQLLLLNSANLFLIPWSTFLVFSQSEIGSHPGKEWVFSCPGQVCGKLAAVGSSQALLSLVIRPSWPRPSPESPVEPVGKEPTSRLNKCLFFPVLTVTRVHCSREEKAHFSSLCCIPPHLHRLCAPPPPSLFFISFNPNFL